MSVCQSRTKCDTAWFAETPICDPHWTLPATRAALNATVIQPTLAVANNTVSPLLIHDMIVLTLSSLHRVKSRKQKKSACHQWTGAFSKNTLVTLVIRNNCAKHTRSGSAALP